MKKRCFTGLTCLAVSLAMLLAACSTAGSDTSTSTQSPSVSDGTAAESPSVSDGAVAESPSVSDGAAAESPSVSPNEEVVFTPGTWLSDHGEYYFFDEGDTTGRTASLDSGTGVGFTYTLSGTEATFSMGGADTSSSCTVSRDGDVITLEWADGTTEQLTYVSDQGSDTFQFYSNQELADLALTYYKEHNGAQDNQNLTSAAQTNEDGSVSIQVYENLGDHNSTAAWYTVDRMTAAGTDDSGNAVDLAGG